MKEQGISEDSKTEDELKLLANRKKEFNKKRQMFTEPVKVTQTVETFECGSNDGLRERKIHDKIKYDYTAEDFKMTKKYSNLMCSKISRRPLQGAFTSELFTYARIEL